MEEKKYTTTERIQKAENVAKEAQKAQETVAKIQAIGQIITDTLQIRDGILVDLKNFSLISIPSKKELMQ
jgi:hypothetical protein